METRLININGHVIKLSIHYIDNEISEVYASIDGMEIEFAYDLEDMNSISVPSIVTGKQIGRAHV